MVTVDVAPGYSLIVAAADGVAAAAAGGLDSKGASFSSALSWERLWRLAQSSRRKADFQFLQMLLEMKMLSQSQELEWREDLAEYRRRV